MNSESHLKLSELSEEAGRGCRMKKRQINPIVCPVCGVTLRTLEVEMHLTSEVEKLNKILTTRTRSMGKNTVLPSSSTSNGTSSKQSSTTDTVKNWEVYQKVRLNRQSRQKVKSSKRKSEEVFCPICNKDISAIAEDLIIHVEMCLRRSESNDTIDTSDVDVEAFDEYEWAGQSRVRATSLLPGGVSSLGSSVSMVDDDEDLNVEDVDDSQLYGESQYSEGDLILPCEDKENLALRKVILGMDPKTANDIKENKPLTEYPSYCENNSGSDPVVEVLKARINELQSREQSREDNYKCLICMDKYQTPVISVCCWHVHCEQCWLQTLGVKKLCPQCNMITSPSDLRKIYL